MFFETPILYGLHQGALPTTSQYLLLLRIICQAHVLYHSSLERLSKVPDDQIGRRRFLQQKGAAFAVTRFYDGHRNWVPRSDLTL